MIKKHLSEVFFCQTAQNELEQFLASISVSDREKIESFSGKRT